MTLLDVHITDVNSLLQPLLDHWDTKSRSFKEKKVMKNLSYFP